MTTAATVAYRLYFPNHKVKLGNTRAKTKNATSAFYHNLAVTPTLFCQVANPKPLHLNSRTHCLHELRLSHSKPPLSLSKPPPPPTPPQKKRRKRKLVSSWRCRCSEAYSAASFSQCTRRYRSIPLRFVYFILFFS